MPEQAERKVVRTTISLPEALYQAYSEGGDPEPVIADRLGRCLFHTSSKPLYFTDDQRRELERLLGRNVSGPAEALRLITSLVTMKVDNLKVELKPRVLERLKSRCFGKPFTQFLAQLVNDELERFVGMR